MKKKLVLFSERGIMSVSSGPLAQLVEQEAFNLFVIGSNPIRPTILRKKLKVALCDFFLTFIKNQSPIELI
tara:strand:- start:666 stop:878 length:213 start_codon:yes stop_codon:yes gene_type:complete